MDAVLRSMLAASILAREVQWSAGRLLTARRATGAEVLLDSATGGEAKPDAPPEFVMSTEGSASDGHIVRQFWDLSRATSDGPGVNCGWNHEFERILGQWEGLEVRTLDFGPALVGSLVWNPVEPMAAQRKAEVAARMLRSVSVGWIPGDLVRRGSLAEDDPLYLPMEDDECGRALEGYVMGTETGPNILVECSLTPIPADQRAVLLSRSQRAAASLGRVVAGERVSTRDVDLGPILLAAGQVPGVRAFIDARIRAFFESPEGLAVLHRSGGASAPPRRLADLFPSSGSTPP